MTDRNKSKGRIVAAAVCLFARAGFYGITTREVAKLAKVSEGNLFRYFPTKRELFLGALESELQKLDLPARATLQVAEAEDANTAMRSVFEVIARTKAKQPELIRLLQFSALEFGADIEPLFRRYACPLIEELTINLQKWSFDDGSRGVSSKPMTAILAFISTVILLQTFFPAFSASLPPSESIESTAAAYADIWCRVLSAQQAG